MKKIYIFLCYIFMHHAGFSQQGQWTWMRGDSTTGSAGSFGVQGVASPTNEPPAVYEASEWTDQSGNFWQHGGQDASFSFYDDMWKYDVTSNQWTWMKGPGTPNHPGVYGIQGVSAPTNTPGSRGWAAASWVDKTGNFWMFGGFDNGSGDMSDLWKFDPTINEWTWMKGPTVCCQAGVPGTMGVPNPANNPAARHECAAAWVDTAGDLWLFGAYAGMMLDDLWRYNIASNEWTWMKGQPLWTDTAIFGTRGVASPANTPGPRCVYSRWADKADNLWLFGGIDFANGSRSDTWKYNITTNQWTWMKGPTTFNSPGYFGSKCNEDSIPNPPSRHEDRSCWSDSCGNFWLFGGRNSTSSAVMNDLWRYSPATNDWIWAGGTTTLNPTGRYNVQGVSSSSGVPTGRMGSDAWLDQSGRLWLFGGWSPSGSMLNDLWRFVPDSSCGSCTYACALHANFTSSDTAFCDEAGKCIDFFDHSTCNPTSWHWIFPGAVPDSSNQQNPTNICYYYTGTYAVTLIVTNSTGTDTLDVTPHIIFANAPPPPSITVFGGDTLVSTHCVGYQWYRNGVLIPGATDSIYIAIQGGTYSVQGTDSLGCYGLSGGIVISGVSSLSASEGITLYPNPASDELTVAFDTPINKEVELSVCNMIGQELDKIILESSTASHSFSLKEFANGIYIMQVKSGTQVVNKKFAVVHK